MTTYKRPTFFDRDLKAFAELSSAADLDLGLVMRSLLVESQANIGTTDYAGTVSVKDATDAERIKLDGALGSIQHGNGSVASGEYAYAGGYEANAAGMGSHAEGYETNASGSYSHAEGGSTYASGSYSHAEGDTGTLASGDASHAEGRGTTASALASHAEGQGTTASGVASHAGGFYTVAAGYGQTAIGTYNVDSNETSLFVVGNGVNSDNRSDAFRVDPALVKSFVPVEAKSQITIGTDSTNGYLALNDSDANEVFTLDAAGAALTVGGRGSAKNASVMLQNASNAETIKFEAGLGRALIGSFDGMAPQAGTLLIMNDAGQDKIQLFGDALIARIGNVFIDGDELGESKISGLTTAMVTAEGDAATKGYVDAVAQGLVIKAACHVSSQANIADLATATEVDGHTLLQDERVLVRFQNNAIENGIYRFNVNGLVRAADMAVGSHAAGSFTFIQFGTNEDSGFVCTADAPSDVVGTDALPWVQFSSAGVIEAGVGLEKVGNTLNVIGVPALFAIGEYAVSQYVTAPNLNQLVGALAGSDVYPSAALLHGHEFDASQFVGGTAYVPGTAVTTDGFESVVPADNTDPAKAYVLGVVDRSNLPDQNRVVRSGLAAGALSGATLRAPYFLQADGSISANLPLSGRIIRVGFATSSWDLWVQIADLGTILA
jgi:hypothetical protein